MARIVYLLCAITSAMCALLLFRAYMGNRARFLMWSALCFAGFTINNIILFGDKVVWPHIDLQLLRTAPAVAGVACLLFGLVWESR